MTEQEAMIRFDFIRCALLGGTKPEIIPNEDNVELIDIAINALEEVQQYRAIGTVEECRAAVEIIRYMIQEGIEPEVLEAYVWFEDELVKKGFTVKSVLEAREKQKPKKPKEYGDKYYGCPTCGNVILHKWEKYPTKLMDKKNGLPYCLNCGQKLDWSDENE